MKIDIYCGTQKLIIHPTRYPELGYTKVVDHWRFVDLTAKGKAVIGPQYPTKDELLADLPRYAKQFGVEDK